jgi:signal recognition particle subunit SRP54
VDAALKEVKIALLEADVNFKVVKKFVAAVKEHAIGSDVFSSLTPGQTVVKIVLDEMTKLLGSEAAELIFNRNGSMSVIMMCGLQGAGKTTTAAKLAAKLKSSGKRPLLVACDVYRPAAIKQLQVNGEKVGVPVFEQGDADPVEIAKAAVDYADKNSLNVLILDTAGRLQIDETLMAELENIKSAVPLDDILLTIDAMTGQEAVNVAATFHERLNLTGVVLTKCDGDTRGGAALSVREVTGCPILYAAMGEKLTD